MTHFMREQRNQLSVAGWRYEKEISLGDAIRNKRAIGKSESGDIHHIRTCNCADATLSQKL